MKLFAKKFFGFNPDILPVITFSQIGSRDSLIRNSQPGDRILFVAVKTEDAEEDDRGKILGMAEIGREKVKTLDLIPDFSLVPDNFKLPNGDIIWPEGIPMLRAWRFVNPINRHEVIKKSKIDGQATRQNAILLDDEDVQRILQLEHVEVDVPFTHKRHELLLKNYVLTDDKVQSWKLDVARMAGTILGTVKLADGRQVTTTSKVKTTEMSEGELQVFLLQKLEEQNYLCAITKRKLECKKGAFDWLAPSADRIDSDGHYTKDNIQIVSCAANRAKGNVAPEYVDTFFEALQFEER